MSNLYSKRKIIEWKPPSVGSPNLQGTKKILDEKGYIKIHAPVFASNKKGYIYEHRLVMEFYLGKKLQPYENIHHINEIKVDNRVENLFLTTNSEHTIIHREGESQSLKRRTNMRNKARKRKSRRTRKRDLNGRYI